MTEEEWLATEDAPALLRYVRNPGGQRKFRLLACACARSRWAGLKEEEYTKAVEVSEACADGLGGPAELRAAAD